MTPEQIAELPYRPCVGVMLMNSAGRIFVGRRNDQQSAAWQMPQGGIDSGEAPRDAALRELWEETGIAAASVEIVAEAPEWLAYDIPIDLVPKVWKGRYRGQQQRWFLLRYLGQDSAINLSSGHPEFSDWRWIAPDALLDAIVPFKRDVYADVIAAFRPHLGVGVLAPHPHGNDA